MADTPTFAAECEEDLGTHTLSTFRNFHGEDSAQSNIFYHFFDD